ncbi:MAG: riboflavin biosynthesis protein RibD [Deltaproteobacteria bacterium]|nr:MAG: riboflavin biosynthesis protein RibD [Deltaproteobacteria bacterium]
MNDRDYMEMALSLAERGRGFTSPNPMVGAVVVKAGEVIGRGWHQRAGGPHAEVYAIDDAGSAARGADIYVTLEPCNHTGRTPPCTEKIINAGICRVVMAMRDPNPVAAGGLERLEAAGIAVVSGVCEEKARTLNESFVKYTQTKKPFVIVKCASTLDGRIATRTGDSKWITGPSARRYVHEIRHYADGILVGAGTVMADDPSLTTRLPDIDGQDPVRIILDPALETPADAKVLRQESDSGTIFIAAPDVDVDRKKLLESRGAKVLFIPMSASGFDLDTLLEAIGGLGITSLLVEGGSQVIGRFLRAGVADKLMLFFAPKLLGGDDGIPVTAGAGPEQMADAIRLDHLQVRRFDDDLLVEGYVTGSAGQED